MKKIGIITTHRANNFGAVFQAFSLVSACRELGADAELIDWRCHHFEWGYHKAWRMYRNPIPAIKHLLWFMTTERPIRAAFNAFRKLMTLSQKITARNKLRKHAKKYDAVIVGSDQVWNPINSAINPLKFDRSNLLDFVPNGVKKFAYAASMGTREINPPSLVPEFTAAWKTFDLITMREHAGAQYVGLQIGKEVEAVVDPVLLHDVEFWRKYEIPSGHSRGKFIFVYNIKNSPTLRNAAERRAKELGLEIVDVIIPSLIPTESYERIGIGPAQFLGCVDEAESVFTNSFHGSALSLIFGKKLFVHQINSKANHNSRFESLFKYANLDGEVVSQNDAQSIMMFDCSKADSSGLNQERERSLSFIKEMVV